MNITLNGQKTAINAGLDIHSLLEEQGYAGKMIAVARNGAFVPRGEFAAIKIEDGDEIEIVAPMQGG